MKISIIGNNLTSLILAKGLAKKNINVEIFYSNKLINYKSNRTLSITNQNMKFIDKNLVKIPKKYINSINEIGIFTENSKNSEILNFKNKKDLFYLMRNQDLFKIIKKNLKGVKFSKIKNLKFYENLIKRNNSGLIINCEKNNFYNKNFFHKKIYKDYKCNAFTFIMNHKIIKNNKAIQIFTKYGPLAFLPLTSKQTSIVFSINENKKKLNTKEILDLVKKYNKIYSITKFSKIEKAKLQFEMARHYYYKNILLFGDTLHRIHPLAGQGFNMTLRDLKILLQEICKVNNLGLPINNTFLNKFQDKTKSYNFLYANGINLIESFFKFDNIFKNKFSETIPFVLNKSKTFKNFFIKVADKGLNSF